MADAKCVRKKWERALKRKKIIFINLIFFLQQCQHLTSAAKHEGPAGGAPVFPGMNGNRPEYFMLGLAQEFQVAIHSIL